MAAADMDMFARTIASEGDLGRRVEALLSGLAERLKATSNDQNVQRLARELRVAAPNLVEAIVAKADA